MRHTRYYNGEDMMSRNGARRRPVRQRWPRMEERRAAGVGMRDSDDHSELRDRGEGESDGRDRATTSAPAPVGACEEE